MRRVLPLVLSVLALSSVMALAQQPARSPSVVIRAARMFDGRSDTTIPDAVIVVEGTTIKAADAHTHLSDESSDNWNADAVAGLRRTVAEAAIRARLNSRSAPSRRDSRRSGTLDRPITSTWACATRFAPG